MNHIILTDGIRVIDVDIDRKTLNIIRTSNIEQLELFGKIWIVAGYVETPCNQSPAKPLSSNTQNNTA